MKFHIALFQPEMPANTGNIARTCAATDTVLHLIRPLGFRTDDKMLKRAGLDYWEHVEIHYHDDMDAFLAAMQDNDVYFVTKFGRCHYSEVNYTENTKDVVFVFGRETKGLPPNILEQYASQCISLPMNTTHVRSLNLSNTAAIVVYEGLRQKEFQGLGTFS
ncbi:MAG: tRNA (uridine(34)/cytosine(34)/5-carboxymethylaminomethyluridine(34)-2'-O)-methyltransferase TrmL [Bacilli bacterium]